MYFSVLASGSTGNSIFVSNNNTKILIDAGLSGAEIQKRLAIIGEDPENIQAIIITHEHTDHVKGAGVLSRRFKIPVYGNKRTLSASASCIKTPCETKFFESGTPFFIGEMRINPFSISHDASDPCGFTIKSGNSKLGIATDLGTATALVKTRLKNCTGLVLEANHDPYLLATGPYPWSLKQRVKGRTGHLSNEEARDLLGEIAGKNLKNIILGHLSKENNCPAKALSIVSQALNNHNSRLLNATDEKPTSIFQI
ncbi:MAG: MBL fold metallo-hydrolase [Desulfobacteraceae bacterium]|nr:MBL fold metallo-hydrolase [Desulfobacteraceae bacterium]MCB9494810.1 MBL fold metallo-hydrolase [Desulfobacteraceae bacterium]